MGDSLTLCLITKNESKNLKRCINSVFSICNEIIVMDTGSTDDTISIALSLGAKVFTTSWDNDFAKARNLALDKCTKDWILVLDADETLCENHDTLLKKAIKDTTKEAFYMKLNNLIGDTVINENNTLRLFRNNPNYRYRNKLHEQIVTSIEEYSTNSFGVLNITINHYGYDHNLVNMENKSLRNIEILNSFEDSEKNALFYFSLANEYMKIGKIEEAKDLFIKSIDLCEENDGTLPYSCVSLIQVLMQLKHYSTALNYADEFLKLYSDFRDIYFLKSAILGSMMKYSESLVFLNVFNSFPKVNGIYPSFNFEISNDIPQLLTNLNALRILKPVDLLSIVIDVTTDNSNYIDTILNVNEISNEIICININNIDSISCNANELGCRVLNLENKNLEQTKHDLMKDVNSKWILYLCENDILDHNTRVNIVNSLKNNKPLNNYNLIKV